MYIIDKIERFTHGSKSTWCFEIRYRNYEKRTERLLEIFDAKDIESIILHKDGFSVLTKSDYSYKYYYGDNDKQIKRCLAGLLDARFNAGLKVFQFYPNIKQEKLK